MTCCGYHHPGLPRAGHALTAACTLATSATVGRNSILRTCAMLATGTRETLRNPPSVHHYARFVKHTTSSAGFVAEWLAVPHRRHTSTGRALGGVGGALMKTPLGLQPSRKPPAAHLGQKNPAVEQGRASVRRGRQRGVPRTIICPPRMMRFGTRTAGTANGCPAHGYPPNDKPTHGSQLACAHRQLGRLSTGVAAQCLELF